MAEIVLDHVVKRYPDGALAVDDFNLEIGDGEFIILVGPSGCGKSTTLNMIAGLEDITQGELRIDGEVVNDKAPKDRDIAMVFQSYALYPHMTVFDNMAFPLVLAGVDSSTIKTKVDEAATMLELTQHLDRKPANLSGGQRQRVAMGRAIVRSPKAFLMDEPLSNLDAKLRVQMRTQVSRIQKSLKTTTVYVTHDQTEAMTLGDRVVVMRGGIVQQVGSPTELYEHPTNLFVGGFIGSPSMNFLPATIDGDRLDTGLGALTMPDPVRRAVSESSGKQVIIGLRPEHFEDASIVGDKPGAEVTVPLDLVESMGSDVYAYFTVQGEEARSGDLEDLAADTGQDMHGDGTTVTARLDAASRVRPGQEAKLWVDTSKMHVFDLESGKNLTAETQKSVDA
ncbi:sn-glycerol-3-phosphate ABC transporter ATP-binding protein UgpC [Phycicoccus sp. CSK15P-2]|uniref:ABC transporter ATP-binding protein n=1 Tax=Phycicoccus sp. CSK15P-2 TaxID=2807627 RepID=UPI00194DEFE9|nr:sn-glycerol-3-phosphate ABC transporter ATP-binding protein UgpC [Phycicoccus sp. CSK15P-2]MBM6405622.1 sn-glycerol-3-phosphate ABC transporter ATP-binding protein UgpC [Phycicoccus sp. CSK15P-2]